MDGISDRFVLVYIWRGMGGKRSFRDQNSDKLSFVSFNDDFNNVIVIGLILFNIYLPSSFIDEVNVSA